MKTHSAHIEVGIISIGMLLVLFLGSVSISHAWTAQSVPAGYKITDTYKWGSCAGKYPGVRQEPKPNARANDHCRLVKVYEKKNGATLTLSQCVNGVGSRKVTVPCKSAPNACGVRGEGFVYHENVSNGGGKVDRQCNAKVPKLPGSYNKACTSPANACGMRQAGRRQCDGSCGATVPSNALCPETTADDNSENVEVMINNIESDAATAYIFGNENEGGNENVPDSDVPEVTIRAIPSLVKVGDTSHIFWSAINVNTCDVYDNVGVDAWSNVDLVSPANGEETTTITEETTYTIMCNGDNGLIEGSATIKIIPTFQEI